MKRFLSRLDIPVPLRSSETRKSRIILTRFSRGLIPEPPLPCPSRASTATTDAWSSAIPGQEVKATTVDGLLKNRLRWGSRLFLEPTPGPLKTVIFPRDLRGPIHAPSFPNNAASQSSAKYPSKPQPRSRSNTAVKSTPPTTSPSARAAVRQTPPAAQTRYSPGTRRRC